MGNKCGIGNKSVIGLIWVNNGVKRRMVNPNKIPFGFVKGKKYATPKKVQAKIRPQKDWFQEAQSEE